MSRKREPEIESLEFLLREATQTVEDQLRLEDEGWINLSTGEGVIITDAARRLNLQFSRLYYLKDPLAKQAIRLWTDYTFGVGMTSHAEEETTENVRKAFWDSKANRNVLSARGQRKSSDKLLVDGEVFFALFLAKEETKIRWIDPLEITEILTDPEDKEDVKAYKREWSDALNKSHVAYYRSVFSEGDVVDSRGTKINDFEDAVVYHFAYNTISQRGNPLLLPALDWIRQYRRFLASRIAVMLALARFAWHTKVKGGQAAVTAMKTKTHEQEIAAGSQLIENLGVDSQPIKTDSGAAGAYQDGRQIKLMIAAATGIPEQYFGDISIGSLATAQTVELPMMKMFQSYQKIWGDVYKDINEVVFESSGIAEDKRYVDMDFPDIAPPDVVQAAKSIVAILGVFPDFANSKDVQQEALMALGINDTAEVLDELEELAKLEQEAQRNGGEEAEPNVEAQLIKSLQAFKEVVRKAEEAKSNGKGGN